MTTTKRTSTRMLTVWSTFWVPTRSTASSWIRSLEKIRAWPSTFSTIPNLPSRKKPQLNQNLTKRATPSLKRRLSKRNCRSICMLRKSFVTPGSSTTRCPDSAATWLFVLSTNHACLKRLSTLESMTLSRLTKNSESKMMKKKPTTNTKRSSKSSWLLKEKPTTSSPKSGRRLKLNPLRAAQSSLWFASTHWARTESSPLSRSCSL